MAAKKTPAPETSLAFTTVGYQLSLPEVQAVLDYLAERPFKEVFGLVSLLTAHPIYEPGE